MRLHAQVRLGLAVLATAYGRDVPGRLVTAAARNRVLARLPVTVRFGVIRCDVTAHDSAART